MSDKPGFSPPPEMLEQLPPEQTDAHKTQHQQSQTHSPPPPQPMQQAPINKPQEQEEWSLASEAKAWGKTLNDSLGVSPIDPMEHAKQQMEDQKKAANLRYFFNKLDSEQKLYLERQKQIKAQEEQVKEEEKKQKKQAEGVKQEQRKQATQQQALFNSQRRTEIKKVGG